MVRFRNWRCYSYGLEGSKKEYGYQELKEYFFIDGSEVAYCKKSFGGYEAGKYYLISDGGMYGYGFFIWQHGFASWSDKEYMKEA